MPSFTLESNFAAWNMARNEKRAEFKEKLQVGLKDLNLLFIAKIQQEQMNFPRSGGTRSFGTRVITSQLKWEWKEATVGANQAILCRVWSTTPYAPMHENAEKDGAPTDGVYSVPEHSRTSRTTGKTSIVRQHLVYFPKRLHVGEAWRQDYARGFVKRVNKIFAETIGS